MVSKKINKNSMSILLVEYLLILFLFLTLTIVQINKPLTGEQDFFAYASHRIADGQPPVFMFGGYDRGEWSALAHPPLYIYSMVIFIKTFGYNLIGLKFSGIFFTILTSVLVLLMGFILFPNKKYLSLLAVFIYLINPITINNALLLDIDGGILTFITILTIFTFIHYKLDKPFILGFLLIIGLWTKTTSFLILGASSFIYFLFFDEKENKFFSANKTKKITKLILIFLISFAAFFITYYIYATMINLDPTQFIKHNTLDKFSSRFQGSLFITLLRGGGGLKTFVIWITPPIILFFFFILMRDAKDIFRKKIESPYIIMEIIIIITLIFYILTGVAVGGSGKYYVFLMPLFAFLIVKEFSHFDKEISKKDYLAYIISAIIIVVYYLIFLKDPLATPETWMIFSQFNLQLILVIALKIIIILFPLIILYFVFRKNIMVSLIFLILVFSLYSAVYTSSVKYSTNNFYGDYGVEEVVYYLKNLTHNNEATIIAERGVAFWWNQGNYLDVKTNNAYVYTAGEYYTYVYDFYNEAKIVKDNTYLVIYEQNIYRTPGFKEHLESHFDYLKTIGYYKIFKIKTMD